jgi:hypothetical protein
MPLPEKPDLLRTNTGDMTLAQVKAYAMSGRMPPSLYVDAMSWVLECEGAQQQESVEASRIAAAAAARSARWTMFAAIATAFGAFATLVAALIQHC